MHMRQHLFSSWSLTAQKLSKSLLLCLTVMIEKEERQCNIWHKTLRLTAIPSKAVMTTNCISKAHISNRVIQIPSKIITTTMLLRQQALTKTLGVQALSKRFWSQRENCQDVVVRETTMVVDKGSQQGGVAGQIYADIIVDLAMFHHNILLGWKQ